MKPVMRTLCVFKNRCYLFALAVIPVFLPAANRETADQKLDTPVHLRFGVTTVKQVVDALSSQTGLKIEASESLWERRLIVYMNDLSARTALDTLAELYDWEWREGREGRIMLTRRAVPLPKRVTEIPLAVQAALSRDFRRFLGIGIPLEEMLPVDDPEWRRTLDDFKRRNIPYLANSILDQALPARMRTIRRENGRFLFEKYRERLLAGKRVPFSELDPGEKERLLAALAYNCLWCKFWGHTAVLHNRLGPSVVNITQVEVNMRGDGLGYGTRIPINGGVGVLFIGGGAQVQLAPGEEPYPNLERPPRKSP